MESSKGKEFDREEPAACASVPGFRSLRSNRYQSLEGLNILGGSDATQKIECQIQDLIEAEEDRLSSAPKGSLLKDLLNISPLLSDGAAAIVDDSFLRCFTSMEPDPWNWNFYLFPIWCMGVLIRYCILFPLRLALLMGGFLIFFVCFFSVGVLFKDDSRRRDLERALVKFQCSMFVASWTGVVKFHGPRPVMAESRVWVANHTSMIDYIILCSYSPFAVIMQLHPGWVGFMQKSVLSCLGCLWFNRTEVKDRKVVAEKMKEHISKSDSTPLLIFPEGTCVNNEYCVMFKKGTFELGATVCPIAIKYNKIFVDAFWNSRRQSFTRHLSQQSGETAEEFAVRVRARIAEQSRLRAVPWDGYLKYYNLGEKHPQLIEKRCSVFANLIRRHIQKDPLEQMYLDNSGGNTQNAGLKKRQAYSQEGQDP